MGHRSQIYLRHNGKLVFASFFHWNCGERMISRARWGMEYLRNLMADKICGFFVNHDTEQIRRVFDVDFDSHDVQVSYDILKDRRERFPDAPLNSFVFNEQSNNGQLFLDIRRDTIYYSFRFVELTPDLKLKNSVLDAEEYMNRVLGRNWRNSGYICSEDVATCDANIRAIAEMAMLMSDEQLEEYLAGDYAEQEVQIKRSDYERRNHCE